MNKNYEDILVFAKDLAGKAGAIMRDYFDRGRDDMQTEVKDNNTPVTIADTKINQMVIDAVSQSFPDHGVLGEELSDHDDRPTLWVCDPIDGTRSFIEGEPTAVFALAFVEDGVPMVAVVYDPFQDKLFTATKGGGAFCNDKPLRVSTRGLNGAIIGASGRLSEIKRRAPLFEALEQRGAYVRFHGGGIFKMMLIAEAKKDGFIFSGTAPHDSAVAQLIVAEAGGRVTDLYGNDQRYDGPTKGVIVSNGVIHEDLVHILHSLGTDDYVGFAR